MKTSGLLVVVGSINADHTLNLPRFPAPGETLTGQNYQIAFGGKGANQAVAAGRSGAKTSFVACIGDDDVGQQICKQLLQDNIDITPVKTIPHQATGIAMIFVNSEGENAMGIYAGANSALSEDYVNACQPLISDASALLMQLEIPLPSVLAAARIAKTHQVPVILNPAPATALSDEMLALVDIITPNETEAETLTGIPVGDDDGAARAANVLHDKGIKTVIITLGSRGVWLSDQYKGQRIAGFKVQAIDTTAAGDTFNGALMTALLEERPLVESIHFAHAAAAIAVTRPGAQSSVPWRREIDDFLKQLR